MGVCADPGEIRGFADLEGAAEANRTLPPPDFWLTVTRIRGWVIRTTAKVARARGLPLRACSSAAVDPNLLSDILTSWMTVVCRRGIPRGGAELRVAKLPKGKRHFIGEFLIALRFT
jgi:hypothetical protein